MSPSEILNFLRECNLTTTILRVLLSMVLGGAIGLQREKNRHAAGFRTHILVCMGATMTVLTGVFAVQVLHLSGDPLRIASQVVSGIGFIGAGTILITQRAHVRGLTTAAGLWATASVGLAVGIGFYEAAILCTSVILIVMALLKSFDRALSDSIPVHAKLYFELDAPKSVNIVLDDIHRMGITFVGLKVKPPRSGHSGYIGLEAALQNMNDPQTLIKIRGVNHVVFALID